MQQERNVAARVDFGQLLFLVFLVDLGRRVDEKVKLLVTRTYVCVAGVVGKKGRCAGVPGGVGGMMFGKKRV